MEMVGRVEFDLVDLIAAYIHQVYTAGHAWVKGVDGPQDLERHLFIGDRRADQGRLIRAWLTLGVAWRAVPGARHDSLVVGDLLVLDMDPVSEGAAWGFGESPAFGFSRPVDGIPHFAPGMDLGITAGDRGDQLPCPTI